MSLVDSFVDMILYAREIVRTVAAGSVSHDDVRKRFLQLFDESHQNAIANDYSEHDYTNAKYAVVAYVDELMQCLVWDGSAQWKKEPLQRTFFDTTNLGDKFYEILNTLNKFGPDREVREVYSLCLGLGFKGKYFDDADRHRHEDIKSFNLGLLLNEEALKDIDSTVLFPDAYGKQEKRVTGNYKPRLNIIPYVIATPFVLISLVLIYESRAISELLNSIALMVN